MHKSSAHNLYKNESSWWDNFKDEPEIENNDLDPPKGGILQTRGQRGEAHIVPFDKLKFFIAIDLYGRYPTISNWSMKCIFVLCDYGSNTILSRPIKSNKDSAVIAAYNSIYNKLSNVGVVPIFQFLDNEISKWLIISIKAKKMKCQLAAPHKHCLNPAERIQTFKNHCVAILAGCDNFFPK